jgi:O-antigen/teichoic acid export membrane protein
VTDTSALARLIKRIRGGTLRVNVAWTAVGNAYFMAVQAATAMVLAKLSSSAVLGMFSFALALITPIVTTASMGLRQVSVTDARGEFTHGHYLGLRLVTSVLASVAIVAVSLTRCDTATLRTTVLLLGVARIAETISDIVHGRFQAAERMDLAAISMIIKGTLSLALFSVALLTTQNLPIAAAGMATASIAALCLFDLPKSRRLLGDEAVVPRFTPRALWAIARIASPITVGVLLTSTAGSIPRYVLEEHHGARAVGYYAAASFPLMVMSFLPGVLMQATLARAARLLVDGQHALFVRLNLRLTAAILALNLSIVAVLALVGDHVLALLFTHEYRHLHRVMVVFTFSQVIAALCTVGSIMMTAARMFRLTLVNTVVALATLLVASHVLVPRYGVLGSAWAEVIRNMSATLIPLGVMAAYFWRRTWAIREPAKEP